MKKLALVLAALLVFTSVPALAVNWNETGLPIVNEPYSFSIFLDDSGLPEDKVMFPILEEMTGITIDWRMAPYQVQTEKLGIELSSGDYADVIAGWTLGDKDLIELGMNDQTFLPLEDLFEKYAPNIMEVLEKPGVRASMTLPDGHIYSIPYVVAEPEVFYIPYINQQWLDRLGLEMPTTPAELKEVLIAFRDQDANGNGDPNDEIPFSGDPNNLDISKLAGWWGVDAAGAKNQFPYFALVDGKITFNANTEGYKQFILFFADLYKEGLIDPEIFTQDVATWSAKGKQDLYGVDISYGPSDAYDDFVEGTEEYEKYINRKEMICGDSVAAFIRSIVGVDRQLAKEKFSQFLNNSPLNALQDEYINQIIGYVCENGDITPETLFYNEDFANLDWRGVFGTNLPNVGRYVNELHSLIG